MTASIHPHKPQPLKANQPQDPAPPAPSIYPNSQNLRDLVQMRRRGIFIYALPNIFTSANLVFGFLAIVYAIDGRFENAAWALILASVFDLLDGRVARLTQTTTKFGVEFDSLCDLVSFGLAPGMLIYLASLKGFGRLGLAVGIIFALCGALRLARFNVLTDVLPKSYFQGLPIPAAASTIATLFFFAKEMQLDLYRSPLVLGLVFTVAILMISTIRFPSFKDIHMRHRQAFGKVAALLLIIASLIIWFEVASFVFLITYITVSLGLDLLRAYSRKRVPE